MKPDHQRFNDSATARAYIRNLANQIKDPEQMMELLNTCDMAQAALVYWLLEESRYDRIQQTQYLTGVYTDIESRDTRETVWNEYNEASMEFQRAKEKLKGIIGKLDMEAVDGAPAAQVDN